MQKYSFSSNERKLLEQMQVPFAFYQMVDNHLTVPIISDGFCDLFGYETREEAYFVMENNTYRDTHPEDVARISEAALQFATEDKEYEVIYRSKNKERTGYNIICARGKHVFTEDGVRLAQVWYTNEGPYFEDSDALELERNTASNQALREENLSKASHYDHLTGLPNMNFFFELVQSALEKHSAKDGPLALLFMDLTGMKYFNHRHGFTEGNKLLKSFSQLLVSYFGVERCSRFGKDHFAALTPYDDCKETVESLFEDIRSFPEDTMLPVRVGVYQLLENEPDISIACDRAKLACDSLKNTYTSGLSFYDNVMREKAARRQYVVGNLDRAIEEGWIKVYFQPIVRAINGRVCDEEALARWIDPEFGMLSPAEFIPVLEETHLIYKLDLHMVELVLDKMRMQEAMGLPIVPQSINLSRADFDSCDIVEEIRKRVDASGFGRDKITVEITESVIGSDFDFMKKQVSRFRELGFSVWMDDFGSGYSSLDVLQSIRFNLIKFDMRFMQQYEEGEKGRVILTELMRMATTLGIETVCEGVETKEQAQFLQEIGCTRLQGYYYSKPISFEELKRRYEESRQIGFENPKESKYFDRVGKINLYDLSMIGNKEENTRNRYFDTLPMAILEVKDGAIRFLRSNQSYREFVNKWYHAKADEELADFNPEPKGMGKAFLNMILQCSQNGNRSFTDEKMADGTTIHSFARRVAVNPVTKVAAVGVVVLSVLDADQGTTYVNIAKALAADYFNLFYVDLETEDFIEYTSGLGEEALSKERHGQHFFATSRRDAKKLLHKADQERFISYFTKENVVRMMDEQGTFTISYRLENDGNPIYVLMKAMRMDQEGRYIILGVSNVDAQMRQKVALDEIRQDQIAYNRIAALSGRYIVLYSVDPETDHYIEYSVTSDYEGLGLSKDGEDFFGVSMREGARTIAAEDFPEYQRLFTRENVMKEIRRKGRFTLRYHLMIDGKAKPVRLQAGLVKEPDGDKLIVGVRGTEEWKKNGGGR